MRGYSLVASAFASDFVPEHLRASGIGWYTTTVGLPATRGQRCCRTLWDRVGHGASFFMVQLLPLWAVLDCRVESRKTRATIAPLTEVSRCA